jgi:hypothetical protein
MKKVNFLKNTATTVACLAVVMMTACSGGGAGSKSGGGDAVGGGEGEGTGSKSGLTTSSGRTIAGVQDYWENIRNEWENEKNEGYVWTISFDDTEYIDIMGLGKVTYKLKLSCSHVGKTMMGPYKGEMAMSYNADLDNLMKLLTLTGGSIDYDADGWFRNDDFIMVAKGYTKDREADFEHSFTQESDLSAEEQAVVDQYMGALLKGMGSGDKAFEKSKTPVAHWYDWDFHMTSGDMSGYIKITGIAYGTTSGAGTVDASGKQTQGYASALGYSERYSEVIDSPFPYILRLYETGEAVFEVFSANGGPVTVKFYGTIDKIRVEDTQVIKK